MPELFDNQVAEQRRPHRQAGLQAALCNHFEICILHRHVVFDRGNHSVYYVSGI